LGFSLGEIGVLKNKNITSTYTMMGYSNYDGGVRRITSKK
jgi:hypothetical protein